MGGEGFEPSNPLRNGILSPAQLARLCDPPMLSLICDDVWVHKVFLNMFAYRTRSIFFETVFIDVEVCRKLVHKKLDVTFKLSF